jgi:hypothetical protein
VAYGSFGYIMVCTTCYYERLLVQILLGRRPAEMITLLPRLNMGPGKGEQLVQNVKEWVEAAKGQMRGETGNLEFGFSLGLTDQTARQLGNRDPFSLDSHELLSLFSFRFVPETQKKRRLETLKRLKEEFDDDLNALNVACDQTFRTWEAAVEALIEDRVTQQEFRAIRREVFRLYETLDLICQTPNVILSTWCLRMGIWLMSRKFRVGSIKSMPAKRASSGREKLPRRVRTFGAMSLIL